MTTSTARHEFTTGFEKPYSVTLWGSNPDETDNDDCWTGEDYATREEAIAVYRALCMFANDPEECAMVSADTAKDARDLVRACGYDWEYVMIDGPDTHEVTANPDQPTQRRHRRENARSDREWQRERAMEAGMLHGVEAYNDEMGY